MTRTLRVIALLAVLIVLGVCWGACSAAPDQSQVDEQTSTTTINVDGTDLTCVFFNRDAMSCDWEGWHIVRGDSPSPSPSGAF